MPFVNNAINVTGSDKRWKIYWDLVKLDVVELTNKIWYAEDIYGRSNIQYSLAQYNYMYQYALLIFNEYARGYTTWEDIVIKYDLEKIKTRLSCSISFDIDKLLVAWGLPKVHDKNDDISGETTLGDRNLQIANTFILGNYPEQETISYEEADVCDIAFKPDEYYNAIENEFAQYIIEIIPYFVFNLLATDMPELIEYIMDELSRVIGEREIRFEYNVILVQ